MPRLSLWNKRKGATYKTMDRWISQMYSIGGTCAYIHKYVGPVTVNAENQTVPSLTIGSSPELTIQDIFFLENRDRKYDENVYELRVQYQVTDYEFDLSQFGLMLPNDITYLSFHLNDTIDIIGRKLISGDVIELPHMREDGLDPNKPAVNKFYAITDVARESTGIAQTWWPHTLRVKVEPLTDSQEYADILDREMTEFNDGFGDGGGGTADGSSSATLRSILSTYDNEIKISDAIADAAYAAVPETNFETAHLYIAPNENGQWTDPWIYAGDGCPPNGAELLGSGNLFPDTAQEGEWFLRTDYTPNVLFRKIGSCWVRQEVDYRRKWKTARRILETFINNDRDVTYTDGTVHKEKVALSKAVKPKTDKLCNNGTNSTSSGGTCS
ncbi:MAG: hypothetical protein HC836_23035 [Richelia sp. RM2_1_2]|nr:hypothetical protein [Richelia sp. RM2_1_2]